jgi:hypothetical protein
MLAAMRLASSRVSSFAAAPQWANYIGFVQKTAH